MNKKFHLFHITKEQGTETFDFRITLEQRLEEHSSGIASKNPVPAQQWQRIGDQDVRNYELLIYLDFNMF